jgi:hypothetical protein
MIKIKTVRKFYLCSQNLKQRKLVSAKNLRDAKMKGPIMAKGLKLSVYNIVEEIITQKTRIIYDRHIHS